MVDLDDPGPDDLVEIREILRRTGYAVGTMSDSDAVAAMRELLAQAIPAPPIKAGSRPVSARVWVSEVLTSGGMTSPEDPLQRAELGDGGEPIDLGTLGILCMRHMSGAAPSGWTDENLADRIGQPVLDLRRGQRLLDEVALLVGRPATPSPEWWKASIAAGLPRSVERWALMSDPQGGMMIVLVVETSDDDELTDAIARETTVPSDHFGGVWGTGELDNDWLIAFQLIELGGGIERTYVTEDIHRELLDAILEVPHLVVVMSSDVAGDANTFEEMAPRVVSALILEVEEASPQVAEVRAQRSD